MTDRRTATLSETARQRVLLLGVRVPVWALAVALAVGAGATGFAAAVPPGAASAPQPSPFATAAASTGVASASVAPEALAPVSSNAPSESLSDRARRGDLAALKQIERHPRPVRPVEQSVALARGHAVLKRADVARLLDDVRSAPSLMDDANTMRLLHRYAHDPQVAVEVLEALAQVDHPLAPDLLFDVWQNGDHPGGSDLAEDLVHHESVRARATPALDVTLRLVDAEGCRKVRDLLPEIVEKADRRAEAPLKRLRRRDGCGDGNREDCFPCLREPAVETRLNEAADEARKRPAPRPWASRKVQDL